MPGRHQFETHRHWEVLAYSPFTTSRYNGHHRLLDEASGNLAVLALRRATLALKLARKATQKKGVAFESGRAGLSFTPGILFSRSSCCSRLNISGLFPLFPIRGEPERSGL